LGGRRSEVGSSALSILHVLASGEVGGLESVVKSLAGGLRRRGHRVGVIAILDLEPAPHPFELSLAASGLPVTPIRLPPRAYLRERRSLYQHFLRAAPQVVHTHGYRADVQAGSVARRLGIATISTVHGFTGGDWKNRLYERLQERALRHCDAVVAVAPTLVDRLLSRGVAKERIHLVRNAWSGASDLSSREEARRDLDLPQQAWIAGWVGRLSREKGADVLLAALAEPAAPSIDVCILGDGPERRSLEESARRLGLGARVRWGGIRAEAARLFPAFDAFVLSSRTEGTPIALFEAMAAEVPIVATRVGGVPDVVGENEAWLVDPEDPKAIARALAAIRTDPPEARRRCEVARRRLTEGFGLEPWIERHEHLYRSLGARAG
jgi:glycosyltransferase involved in cell wall biosynthesis